MQSGLSAFFGTVRNRAAGATWPSRAELALHPPIVRGSLGGLQAKRRRRLVETHLLGDHTLGYTPMQNAWLKTTEQVMTGKFRKADTDER